MRRQDEKGVESMRKPNRSSLVLLLAALMAIALAASSQAAPSYMDPKDAKAGMAGEGLTVFYGSEPSAFSFRVIAVTKGDSGLSDLIIVKVTGKQIEEIGGIAAGMSGSPCYIGDRLLGALSHVLEGPDSSIGIITPMSQMVKILEAYDFSSLYGPIEVEGWGTFKTAAGPVWVGGLNSRGLGLLQTRLGALGFAAAPLPLGTGIGISQNTAYAAGSSIAVQLCNGDIEAGSIGTVTWSDGRSFLAMGHPFMNLGEVGFPMSKSQVLAVLPSNDFPFKLGTFENPGAIVTQDRASGIAGLIGPEAQMTQVQIKVNDMQTGRRSTSDFSCVPDARLIEGLVSSALLSVVDSTIMRVGEGTAYITVSMDVSGMKLLREDMVWSASDIASFASFELSDIMDLMLGNDVDEPVIADISVSLDIAPVRLTSTIVDLKLPEGGFKAGETSQIGVVIRPFREVAYTEYVEIEIPEGVEPGDILIVVRGGSSEDDAEVYTIVDKVGETEGVTLVDLLEAIEGAEQNNELIIEISYALELGSGDADEGYEDPDSEESEPIYSAGIVIQSIIRGYISVESEIK